MALARVETPEVPEATPPSPAARAARALGLPSATALVIGSIIGTGVFTMPAVMAGAGTSSIIVLGVISIGALLLAVLFGQLTKRIPSSDGGLYAYARHEFGDFAGYLTAWCYWITAWAGNAAIVSSWVLYVESLFSISRPTAWTNFGIAVCGLWIPAAVNLAGIRRMALFQNVSVVLKFLPLAVVGIVGWFFVRSANFGPFNATGGSLYSGIGIAAGVALFSFIGVEVASITAARVKDPRRNVGAPRSRNGGLRPVVPPRHRGRDGPRAAPQPDWKRRPVCQRVPGHVHELLLGRKARRRSRRRLRHRRLERLDAGHRRDAASGCRGRFVPAAVREDQPGRDALVRHPRLDTRASLLMAFAYSGKTGLTVFTYLVDLSVVTVAIPYFFSACAQLAYLVSRRRRVNGWILARDLLIACLSVLFSLWVGMAAGYQSVYQAMLLLLVGIPIYAFLKARRERLGQTPEPDEAIPADEPVTLVTVPGE